MKFSGKIEDGTSNRPLNFGSDLDQKSPALGEVCTLRVLLVLILILVLTLTCTIWWPSFPNSPLSLLLQGVIPFQ